MASELALAFLRRAACAFGMFSSFVSFRLFHYPICNPELDWLRWLKLWLASDLGRNRVHEQAGELGSVVGIVLRRVVAVHGGGDGDGSPICVEIRDAVAVSSAVEAS
ncbi:hypothetical protein C1H46_006729 [Malus baccata]|uniref:Uncharacterized protein n=1 Tax=Malus baccata TaxID=106549 RepID=A0A540N9C8_MALBA|nr:hypothetical protein C1H46_006729 [Malus baccata]